MTNDRKALIVGIDFYEYFTELTGCANDARNVERVLECHGVEEDPNFEVRKLIGRNASEPVTLKQLRESVKALFSGDPEIALFYFAGHGIVEATGGYLITSEAEEGDEGLAIADILKLADGATKGRRRGHRIIILDCCHAGIAGNEAPDSDRAELMMGTTILAASTNEQYASEQKQSGLFTGLFVDALEGAAANLLGEITPGSVYAHVDQSLAAWDQQRPVFKTHVDNFISLRRVPAPVSKLELRELPKLFPNPKQPLKLNPTFEPELKGRDPDMPPPDPKNTAKFKLLQKFNRVNLVVPVNAPHMWHAAMWSQSCRLTALGEHYWKLAKRKRFGGGSSK